MHDANKLRTFRNVDVYVRIRRSVRISILYLSWPLIRLAVSAWPACRFEIDWTRDHFRSPHWTTVDRSETMDNRQGRKRKAEEACGASEDTWYPKGQELTLVRMGPVQSHPSPRFRVSSPGLLMVDFVNGEPTVAAVRKTAAEKNRLGLYDACTNLKMSVHNTNGFQGKWFPFFADGLRMLKGIFPNVTEPEISCNASVRPPYPMNPDEVGEIAGIFQGNESGLESFTLRNFDFGDNLDQILTLPNLPRKWSWRTSVLVVWQIPM